MKMEDITEVDFKAYEEVRASGVTNMWNVPLVQQLSGLEKEMVFLIMKKYMELMKKFPNVRKGD